MQNLPPFVYAKAFWEGLSIALSGLLALGVFFGWFDASWALPATVISSWIFALLRMFGIHPELMLKTLEGRLRRAEALVEEAARVRNDLLGFQKSGRSLKNTSKDK